MNNYISLEGKVALVTGGASGIGYATAVAFAESGAAVAINYHRNESGAELLRKQIIENGGRAITIQADVRKANEIEGLVKHATAELGPVERLLAEAVPDEVQPSLLAVPDGGRAAGIRASMMECTFVVDASCGFG